MCPQVAFSNVPMYILRKRADIRSEGRLVVSADGYLEGTKCALPMVKCMGSIVSYMAVQAPWISSKVENALKSILQRKHLV